MKQLKFVAGLTYVLSLSCFAWNDADSDGVPDIKDACAGTPDGIFVQANGCGSSTNLCLPSIDGGILPKGCDVVSIKPIYFELGQANIAREQVEELQKVSQFMQVHNVNLYIVGHADISGKTVFNLDLSKARATAVKQMLTKNHGIAANRLIIVHKGSQEASLEQNASQRAYDRRVDFIVEKQ